MKKLVEETVNAQITQKNVKSQPGPKSTVKGHLELALVSRLALLNHQGMVNLIERLCNKLNKIKAAERSRALKSDLRAIAQRRILLPGANDQSVQSLVAWIYHTPLPQDTPANLYNLYELATKLRIDALAEKCMSQLANTASDVMQQAHAQGTTLGSLLGYSSSGNNDTVSAQYVPPENTVKIVFDHVLNDDNPPARLSQLVIDALARHMDLELWLKLRGSISDKVTHQLIEAMVMYRAIKAEQTIDTGRQIKLENHYAAENVRSDKVEAHHELALVG